jgi:uncharacterized surface protein with fasciclin (FAS1) repeats
MRALISSAAFVGLVATSTAAFAGNCAQRGPGMGYMGYMQHPAAMPYVMQRMPYHPYPMALAGYGLQKTGHHEGQKAATGAKDIVDVAVAAGSFSTLATALKEAGLVETLKGEGPFTVFAPTDEAFAKIPEADLKALLADKAALTKVLTYHVVPGKVMAADVLKLTSAKTVQGQSVTIDTRNGVKVDGASVVKTDIVASNGIIHVIDTVILPK